MNNITLDELNSISANTLKGLLIRYNAEIVIENGVITKIKAKEK